MSLPVYFAPMEGVTDSVYRRVHHAHFTGIDRYYIPFISPTQNLVLTPREKHNVLPEYNTGLPVVPQVLTKKADHFIWAAQLLYDMGYEEVNLNTGCPSGTVTAKGKGAGMLIHVSELETFFDEIFARTPVRVSVKTRIGFSSPDEFAHLLDIFNRYPISELTIHPRTRGILQRTAASGHLSCRGEGIKAPPRLQRQPVYSGGLPRNRSRLPRNRRADARARHARQPCPRAGICRRR